jgi:hypothetical protein
MGASKLAMGSIMVTVGKDVDGLGTRVECSKRGTVVEFI